MALAVHGQISAIVWAQFRIMRNHLPRTGVGGVFMWILTALWYGLFIALAGLAASTIPTLNIAVLAKALPIALLAVFLYNQTIPLITLSTGWSLQLNKLQVYPIPHSALFGLEALLRISSAPEFIVLLIGGVIGLARRPDVPLAAAFSLLLYIPINLFLQLAVRDFVVHTFSRNRFREIITIFFIGIGLLPQLLVRTGLAVTLKPYFFMLAQGVGSPWQASAGLSLGRFSLLNFFLLAAWTFLAFVLARRQFTLGLLQDDSFRGNVSKKAASFSFFDGLANLFKDPTAAILEKEFRSLLRMPRFRIMFGMACIFSAIVFLPMRIGETPRVSVFLSHNYFAVVNLYALLILADGLLLNIFGVDRAAAQLYYLTPVDFQTVVKAKNLVACAFILIQNLAIAVLTPLFTHISFAGILAGFLASTVATVHLMWAGNLLSVMLPRPIDPSSAFRKQASGKVQLWVFLCTIGMAILMGFAYLAGYAFHSDWAILAVLFFELAIGLVVYRVALDSTVARGVGNREFMIDTLSKTSSPVAGSLGLG